ncbi:heavy metal translocatin [Sesbania bispinosa]|nr:heavy metal translocatin [Sesbania bispinosa]
MAAATLTSEAPSRSLPLLRCSNTRPWLRFSSAVPPKATARHRSPLPQFSARTGDLHVAGRYCSDCMSQPNRLISPPLQQHGTIPPLSSSHRSAVQATNHRRSSAIVPFLVVSTLRQPPYVATSPGRRLHLYNPSSITLKP